MRQIISVRKAVHWTPFTNEIFAWKWPTSSAIDILVALVLFFLAACFSCWLLSSWRLQGDREWNEMCKTIRRFQLSRFTFAARLVIVLFLFGGGEEELSGTRFLRNSMEHIKSSPVVWIESKLPSIIGKWAVQYVGKAAFTILNQSTIITIWINVGPGQHGNQTNTPVWHNCNNKNNNNNKIKNNFN